MKKIKQIECYYCNYCGKECEHTEYIMPSLEKFPIRGGAGLPIIVYNELETKIQPTQVDICPNCQDKIAVMLDDIIKENNRKIIRKSEDYDFSRYY